MGGQGVLKEFPGGSALLTAGVQNRPNAGVPLSAHQGTAPLCDSPINDKLTNTLLATIVGRWYRRVEQESEDCIAMFAQPLGQRRRLGRQVLLFGQSEHPFFDSQHALIKLIFGDFVALMPKTKHILKLEQQGLSKGLIVLARQCGQKLNITNQNKFFSSLGLFLFGEPQF